MEFKIREKWEQIKIINVVLLCIFSFAVIGQIRNAANYSISGKAVTLKCAFKGNNFKMYHPNF